MSADAGRISNNYIFLGAGSGGNDFHRQPRSFAGKCFLLNAMRRGRVLVKTVVEEGEGCGGAENAAPSSNAKAAGGRAGAENGSNRPDGLMGEAGGSAWS